MILTTGEAAKALSISKSRIDYLCKTGRLAYTMHGRDRAITQEAVEAYRQTRKVGRPRKERE